MIFYYVTKKHFNGINVENRNNETQTTNTLFYERFNIYLIRPFINSITNILYNTLI